MKPLLLPLPLLLCSALGFWAPCAFSQTSTVPALLSYQGLLSDSTGTLIGAASPVNRTIQFRLYNASTGGTPIWAESQVVTISAGEFSVLIGNGSGISGISGPSAPAALPFKSLADAVNTSASGALFLGLTVDDASAATTDVEVSPRQQLVSGMFALRARVAETVATGAITSGMIADSQVSTNALQTSAVTTVKLADSAITSDKIADGAVLAADLASAAVTSSKIDTNTVGIWNVNGASVYRNGGNVGILTGTPGFPLSFSDVTGDKISFSGQSGAHYGVGLGSSLLQIHTSKSSEDLAFGYGASASFTETVRVKGNGNVGIGTSAPGYPLSFADVLGDKITLFHQTGEHYGFGVQPSLLQIHSSSVGTDVAIGYGRSSAFTETMRIKGSGMVGIKTTTPLAPLHVASTASFNLNIYGYLNKKGNVGDTVSLSSNDYSIYAVGRIACSEFNAFSDKRLKKEITPISGPDAMRFVRAVPAVSFRWKTGSETGLKYGYIAQDVAKMGMENLVGLTPDPELEEVVDENLFVSPKGTRLSLNYISFIPLLSAAVGDLDDRSEAAAAELKAALARKDAQIGALEARIATLEKLMGASK
jgi:hypothetical protein